MNTLIMGAGNRPVKQIKLTDSTDEFEGEVCKVDFDPASKPDVLWDLTKTPYPFAENEFDEIHCYDVMEHLHQQGDYKAFFRLWSEIYRIMKPGGLFFGKSPHHSSNWAWGDPGHTCVYGPELMTFLDQQEYINQIGNTPMTDYRRFFQGDLPRVYQDVTDTKHYLYVVQAIKPSRIPKETLDELHSTGTSPDPLSGSSLDFGDAGC